MEENGKEPSVEPEAAEPAPAAEEVDPQARHWLLDAPAEENGKAATPDPIPADPAPAVEEADPEASQWRLVEPSAPSREAEEPASENGDAKLEQRVAELEEDLEHAVQRAGEEAAKAAKLAQDAAELREAEQALIEQRERIDELGKLLAQREAELDRVQRAEGGSLEQREADLEKHFDQRQAELEKQLVDVEERLDMREAELREQARQREGTLNGRIEELEATLAEAQQRAIAKPGPRRAAKRNGKLDLNEVTFEQLRDLGLSVTLSARVISYRDSRGGFESVNELDEIPGLSVEFSRVLRDQLKLG